MVLWIKLHFFCECVAFANIIYRERNLEATWKLYHMRNLSSSLYLMMKSKLKKNCATGSKIKNIEIFAKTLRGSTGTTIHEISKSTDLYRVLQTSASYEWRRTFIDKSPSVRLEIRFTHIAAHSIQAKLQADLWNERKVICQWKFSFIHNSLRSARRDISQLISRFRELWCLWIPSGFWRKFQYF